MPERELSQLLEEAKRSSGESRNRLIQMYQPFILKVAARVSGRFIRAGSDDEASIAMIAFNEAIDRFDQNKGNSFFGFAEMVIRRRLIDYYRKENNTDSLLLKGLEDETRQETSSAEIAAANSKYQSDIEVTERREEIKLFSKKLASFGIQFADLVKASPKHESARIRAMEAAALIVEDKKMLSHLERKRTIPMKELAQRCAISRKTLERQRKYIIGITIILNNDFFHLKEYIKKIL